MRGSSTDRPPFPVTLRKVGLTNALPSANSPRWPGCSEKCG